MKVNMAGPAELGKRECTLIFNKHNGQFLWLVAESRETYGALNEELFIYRWVELDFNLDAVEGQLKINSNGTVEDAFKIVAKADQVPNIFERNLNKTAETKITKEYPVVKQLNILSKLVRRMAEKVEMSEEDMEELNEMESYIALCIKTNQNSKAFYRENPDVNYYTDEQLAERTNEQLAGGVHEYIGPRPVTGGRIFGTDS